MHNFEIGDFVEWSSYGEKQIGSIVRLGAKYATVVNEDGFEERRALGKLKYLPPICLSGEEFARLARLDTDVEELLRDNTAKNVKNVEGYAVTVRDLLVALEKIEGEDCSEQGEALWLECVSADILSRFHSPHDEFYGEVDALMIMREAMAPFSDCWLDYEGIEYARQIGENYLANKDKPMLEREYPIEVKEGLLMKLERDAAMEQASEEEIILYRRFAEELAEAGKKQGLLAVGYGCYGGNRAFECDWERARDTMIRLFDAEEKMPDKAFYANTLGYIYYYGRCNGGEGEYDLAYKYFSFGAFNGIYESRYKVADMYRRGLGVPKSEKTYERIINDLYYENLAYIENGEFDCKFADVALRMGSICEHKGDGLEGYEQASNYHEALYYYTQADYAIRMRMQEMNYYGDEKVKSSISEALSRMKEACCGDRTEKIEYYSLRGLVLQLMRDGKKLDFVIKPSGKGYKIVFYAHNRRDGKQKKLFLTLSEIGFCGLVESFAVSFKAQNVVDEKYLNVRLTAEDCLHYGLILEGGEELILDGSFVVRRSRKPEKKYSFVSVSFGTEKLYDYLCDDETVEIGDRILVDAGGEEKTVAVIRKYEKSESELALPLGRYKRITGRL